MCLSAFQPALTKPEALQVFPGQVAQLSCTISPRYAIIGDLGVSWYQQLAGSAPRLLLYYRSEEDQHRAPGIPDRFSAAADVAHNTCILTISPVQPEVDADYYCFVGDLFSGCGMSVFRLPPTSAPDLETLFLSLSFPPL